MPLEEIPFGGLAALEADEKVPVGQALDATNCYVDDNSLRGRNGYRAATAAPVGSGAAQGLWRYRPGSASARTVAVRGGAVNVVTDPSAETNVDGAATALGTPFGGSANISAAQLGKYLYLASDESGAVWRRVNPAFALESITTLPQPAAPTASAGALALTLLSSLSAPVTAGGAVVSASGISDWSNISGTIGGTVVYTLSADQDWSATKWLFVACSPETTSGGGGTFAVEVATSAGSFELLAVIGDTPGDGSPYAAYLSLQGLTSATRSAVRRLRFRQVGPTTDPFSVSAFMPVPSAPAPGQVSYYVTFFNSVTGQESALSTNTDVVYSSDGVNPPTFHAARWNYNSFLDQGVKSTNPDSFGSADLWNKGANLASPSSSEFAAIRTFSGAIPTGAQVPAADTVRLWRLTSVGIRLVGASCYTTRANGSAWTAAGSTGTASDLPVGATFWISNTWSIADNVGDAALSHALYKAGGTPPPCLAMAAVNGRLITGGDPANPSRVSISSYLPFGQDTDPFPQFPAIPLIPADGWSFDIAPTSSEGVLWCGRGDNAAYILTNEATYLLTNLDAPLSGTPPLYKVWERGVISRRGACWAEEALYWCAHDGIYRTQARASAEELTKPIRRLFRAWFQPDATVVMGYQDRKLYAIRGQNMLRFDFVTGTWTRHTPAHTLLHGDDWRDPTGIYQQMWFQDSGGNLFRWQPGLSPTDSNRAVSDAGTAIPAWTYSTGFSLRLLFSYTVGYGDVKTRVRSVFCDTAGDSVMASLYKDATASPTGSKIFAVGEHQLPFAPEPTAYKWRLGLAAASNAASVRRLLWERPPVSGEGG
jgi:hypothetical protein